MPSFEQLANANSSNNIYNNQTYDRIIATFRKNNNDQSVASRDNRVNVALKDATVYDYTVNSFGSEKYQLSAGANLSTLLMPFETRLGSQNMPAFHADAENQGATSGYTPNLVDCLPMQWDSTKTDVVLDRYSSASGDSLSNLISDETFRGDTNQFRDISNIRSVGLRLPAMGIGWGHTTDGRPWPSGDWNNIPSQGFKAGSGKSGKGWMVDPSDYIAAPIDLRYDRRNNVWTCPKGFWAEILASGTKNGKVVYAWQEKMVSVSGTLGNPPSNAKWYRRGTTADYPAYEVNERAVPSGTKVWIQIPERTDNIQFEFGGGGGLDVLAKTGLIPNVEQLSINGPSSGVLSFFSGPSGVNGKTGASIGFDNYGSSSYLVLSVVNGNVIWDYPRVNAGS